jgi:hypothetical protein
MKPYTQARVIPERHLICMNARRKKKARQWLRDHAALFEKREMSRCYQRAEPLPERLDGDTPIDDELESRLPFYETDPE